MAKYPRIDSPCPLKWNALPEPGNDFCRHCERNVHNLTAMTEAERKEFMAACEGSVCVAYVTKPGRRERNIVWAVAMAAATVAVATPGMASAAGDSLEMVEVEVLVGGVKNASQAEWEEVGAEEPPADLPVIVDDDFESAVQQNQARALTRKDRS